MRAKEEGDQEGRPGKALPEGSPEEAAGRRPLAALAHRDFRLYWVGTFAAQTGSQMQLTAVAWQVYVLTHSALALGLIGLFRLLPILVLSLYGGVVADVLDRRQLLIVTNVVRIGVTAALAYLTLTGLISVWMVYALSALASATLAFDTPARQALVPSLVPPRQLASAISLGNIVFQVGTIIGPSLSGLIIAAWSIGTVYVIGSALNVFVVVALVLIHPRPITGGIQKVSLAAALEGLRFVFRTPIILANMSLDFVATFFGSATALLPIFARDILHVGSQGYGVLYAAPSAGAVLTGVALSFYSDAIRAKGWTILVAVGAYAACTVVFGLSRSFPLSLLALAGTGASDTISMILRQTVRQLVTPDALRGRMTSVNMVFFMGGPQLGELEAGAVAAWLGAPFSVISGGVGALLAVIAIGRAFPTLRRYRD